MALAPLKSGGLLSMMAIKRRSVALRIAVRETDPAAALGMNQSRTQRPRWRRCPRPGSGRTRWRAGARWWRPAGCHRAPGRNRRPTDRVGTGLLFREGGWSVRNFDGYSESLDPHGY